MAKAGVVWKSALHAPPSAGKTAATLAETALDRRMTNRCKPSHVAGIACGVGAAVFWAAGFVTARHGIDVGFSPFDILLHRFVWSALLLLPLFVRNGVTDLNGIGWGRGIMLTIFGGPVFAIVSYSGFLLVPLGHGGVIQPSCAALTGLLLATVVLRERLPPHRAIGALVIVLGLVTIGGEAIATIGTHGVVGDLMFVAAGCMFGTFGMLLRLWRLDAIRATVVVSIVSSPSSFRCIGRSLASSG